jgi:endonuclease YncB( thermonuclease family)
MTREERVVRVIDGATFATASRKHPIRLAGVDAPVNSQPGHAVVRSVLSRLTSGRRVAIDTQACESYGRPVATVKVGGRSVNRAVKKHGA